LCAKRWIITGKIMHDYKFHIYDKFDKRLYTWDERDTYPWFMEIINNYEYQNNDEYKIHQYTGMNDYDGNEIFYGCDIVRVTVFNELGIGCDTVMEGVLYFSKKNWRICLKGYESFHLVHADIVEIINNIYA
jgi:hypothetical protein